MWTERMGKVRDLPGDSATEAAMLALAFFPHGRSVLRDGLAQANCLMEMEDGQAVLAAANVQNRGLPRFVFAEATGELRKIGSTMFSDYRPVGAVRLPFLIQGDASRSYTVEKVRFNVPLEDALFIRPAAVAADGRAAAAAGLTKLSAPGQIEIVRRPSPANFRRGKLARLPSYDPASGRNWQVDLRGFDLSGLDLSGRLDDLLHADFDSKTRWPDTLPAGFMPEGIVDMAKNPGLGVRVLHARGIDGRGVGIGIIDQCLLVEHAEYRDRLRSYEEIHLLGERAQMHGPAVASIAVGKSVGVAPGADLYYIAETHGTYAGGKSEFDFTWVAQSIDRLLEINRTLPTGRKIRAISISVGWNPQAKGFAEVQAAVGRATQANVFVISTAIRTTHNLMFSGLGRAPLADPERAESYGPGSFWRAAFFGGETWAVTNGRLMVPMDSRAVASPTGPDDYVFYADGGYSWSVPWIAGLYALACQVKPDITPEVFWAEAIESGKTIQVRQNATASEVEFGKIADPVGLITRLKPAGVPITAFSP